MKSVVKISWSSDVPKLVLAGSDSYDWIDLEKGMKLDLELSNQKRCTGYHSDVGEMEPCPEFKEISSGDKCENCRKRDIYTRWRQGDSEPGIGADYSVYLAQCGSKVKVGVTRTERLKTRWLEQGAEYGAELYSEIDGDKALKKEKEISEKEVPERIRKTHKTGEYSSFKIKNTLERLGFEDKAIQEVSDPINPGTVARKGLLPSPIGSVKGQIISDGRVGMIMNSGKVLKKPSQQTIENFGD